MSFKKKIVVAVSSFALVCVMLMVGVWALKTVNFSVGGNISFSATGINATISKGTLAGGSWVTSTDADSKMQEIVLNTDKTLSQIETEFQSWSGLNLLFNESGDDVTITFTITNNSTNADEYIDVNVNVSGGTMKNATASINTSSALLTPNGGSQEFVITFSVTDKTANASLADFNITFAMEYAVPVDSGDDSVSALTFSYSDETATTASVGARAAQSTEPLTASITDCDTTVTEVEIPMLVKNNDKVYLLTSIDKEAFDSCTSLTRVEIPSSVTSIGDWAFYDCTGLANLTIGSGVTSIGSEVFSGCTGLESMNYLGDINSWVSISFGDTSSNPTYYTKSLTIQGNLITSATIDKTTSICPYAFYNCANLTEVIIGGQATSIGKNAFYNCTSLTSIEIPSSMISIGSSAFNGCSALEYETYDNAYYLGNSTNPYVVLMKVIDSTLSSTKINNICNFIYDSAFYNYTSLTSIEIPSSVTSIGNNAFSGCTGLASMNYLGDINNWVGISFGSNSSNPTRYTKSLTIQGNPITSATIDKATSIGKHSYYNCTNLTEVIIGGQVTSIGSYAFYGCTGLASMNYLGDINSWVGISFGDTYSNPTYYTKSLTIQGNPITSATIDKATSIGKLSFYNCTNLTEVIIGGQVTSIGSAAFYGCTGLASMNYLGDINNWVGISFGTDSSNPTCYTKSLTIQGNPITSATIDKATSIGKNSFYNCTNLTEVIIGGQVTSIGSAAFSGCTGLASIEIPASVTNIGSSAFAGCTGLASMNYLGDINSWVGISFGDTYSSPTKYTKSLVINGETITSITAEDLEGVTSIGSYAFSGCTGLASIEIPASVTSIGGQAFISSGLTSMNYLGTLKEWVSISFTNHYSNPTYYTKSLVINGKTITSITAEDLEGVTSIGSYSFYGCEGLTSIRIPASVTSIKSYAFSGCTSLTTIIINSETIASKLTSKTSSGYVINYATTIYIDTDIVTAGNVGSYVTNTTNFPNVETISEGEYAGYTKYSKS